MRLAGLYLADFLPLQFSPINVVLDFGDFAEFITRISFLSCSLPTY